MVARSGGGARTRGLGGQLRWAVTIRQHVLGQHSLAGQRGAAQVSALGQGWRWAVHHKSSRRCPAKADVHQAPQAFWLGGADAAANRRIISAPPRWW